MSWNKGVLRSLYLRSNSSSLLSGALRLLYLWNNSSSLLKFDGVIGRLRLLYLRRNSSPPALLSSSLLSSKLMLLLLLLLLLSSSSLLSILFLSLSVWPEVLHLLLHYKGGLPLHHLFCLHWLGLINFQLLDSEYQFFLRPWTLHLMV